MEENTIDWTKVAETVRRVAQAKAQEAKENYPFLTVQGGPKKAIERALGLSHGRVFDARWEGDIPYTLPQVAVIADLLGVRTADLLNPDTE